MSNFARGVTILNIIAEGRGQFTLTDLANRSDIPRSSVHRIVQQLESERFVIRQSPASGYSIGPGLLKFGLKSHLQLVTGMRPLLVSLAQAVNENVELAMFSGREVIVVDQVASTTRSQALSPIGKSLPLGSSCLAKVLLAELEDAAVCDILDAQPPRSAPIDRDALLTELHEVRRTGIAQQRELGVSAMATCVHGSPGITHAVAIVAPTDRFDARSRLFAERLGALRAEAASRAELHARGLR